MIPRVLEPEVMDTREEAVDYNSMDHGEVNRVFVDDFLEAIRQPLSRAEQTSIKILDVGTGTALIPIELCRRPFDCQVVAIDLAKEMLKIAERNVEVAGFQSRVRLSLIDAKQMPYPDDSFDAVISNSIIHHVPEPLLVLKEMLRVLRRDGQIFVRDLLRPDDMVSVDRLVEQYAGDENPHQQQMFRDSLHAALRVEEMQEILHQVSLSPDLVKQSTNRHWTLSGRIQGA